MPTLAFADIGVNSYRCPYCTGVRLGLDGCGEIRDGHVCTRPKGHDESAHVACGISQHVYHAWTGEEAS